MVSLTPLLSSDALFKYLNPPPANPGASIVIAASTASSDPPVLSFLVLFISNLLFSC